ncbi:flagellar biosynthetic protein FliO [Desulfoscipio gibsoniae]|uniref:Flagellar protein n=1 Tax=Desulfoscipio gibsoniae DSM 7213 TaxID=767817 RepID=R4KJ42_9FIRM|nr:flagellar biosynthetic protein FliO [Desulfoscipio gibsoniae]AGL01647.1 flagellar biosynthetic protein FliO [Desulfoscipio gibsoniae DSM 7213]
MDRDIIAALVRIIFLLPLICGLAYLTVKFGFSRMKMPFTHVSRRMRALEQLSLGPKSGLTLVQVGKKYLLFAHREGSIILVKEMDELPEEIESTLPEWKFSQLFNKQKP